MPFVDFSGLISLSTIHFEQDKDIYVLPIMNNGNLMKPSMHKYLMLYSRMYTVKTYNAWFPVYDCKMP